MTDSQKFATIAACSEKKEEIKNALTVFGFIIDFDGKIKVRSVFCPTLCDKEGLNLLTTVVKLNLTDTRLSQVQNLKEGPDTSEFVLIVCVHYYYIRVLTYVSWLLVPSFRLRLQV